MKKLLSLILLLSFTIKAQDVTIGTQTWTSKNLNVSKYKNGDKIPQVQDAAVWVKLTTGAWCYYENKAENGAKYGKLYNWYAVNDPRGLAPNGYHIPTDAECTILTDYLGGEEVAGKKMKSTSGWKTWNWNKNNGNGTNTSGFAGLPGGSRDLFGYLQHIGSYGHWWSSSEGYNGFVFSLSLLNNYGCVFRGSKDKTYGLSVRCLKD